MDKLTATITKARRAEQRAKAIPLTAQLFKLRFFHTHSLILKEWRHSIETAKLEGLSEKLNALTLERQHTASSSGSTGRHTLLREEAPDAHRAAVAIASF